LSRNHRFGRLVRDRRAAGSAGKRKGHRRGFARLVALEIGSCCRVTQAGAGTATPIRMIPTMTRIKTPLAGRSCGSQTVAPNGITSFRLT